MFKHFIITRFNLKQEGWNTNKNNKAILTEEWHKNRFKLFTDFCFSSVASQTNKNFEWLVFFDTNTPKKYKDIIISLELKMSNFIPVFVDDMSYFLPSIKSYIAKNNEKYIITSRLDNDDCISKFYVEEIQKRFNNQDFMALDFVDGYTIQTQPNVKIGKRFDQYNPFISLIEKNNNPKSVWFLRHSHWKREKNIEQIRGVRTWASIIHQENKVNEFFGYGDVNFDKFFNDFEIGKQQKEELLKNVIPYSKWKYQSIKNANASYWNYTFKNIKKKLGVYKLK